MSTLAIFIAGTAVTLMVGTALALVVLAAVQDGKDEDMRGEEARETAAAAVVPRAAAAPVRPHAPARARNARETAADFPRAGPL